MGTVPETYGNAGWGSGAVQEHQGLTIHRDPEAGLAGTCGSTARARCARGFGIRLAGRFW
jgi:hypothetical protein